MGTKSMPAHTHTNRLAQETSPYLLQHAAQSGGLEFMEREALERAKRENRPIFFQSDTALATGAMSWSGNASRTMTSPRK